MFQSIEEVKAEMSKRATAAGFPPEYAAERVDDLFAAERSRGGTDAGTLAYVSVNDGHGYFQSIQNGWEYDGRNHPRWKAAAANLAGANPTDTTRPAP